MAKNAFYKTPEEVKQSLCRNVETIQTCIQYVTDYLATSTWKMYTYLAWSHRDALNKPDKGQTLITVTRRNRSRSPKTSPGIVIYELYRDY